ncbi:TPA: hypothetical protein ACL4FU_002285, partial [Streptococcus pneumoniae]
KRSENMFIWDLVSITFGWLVFLFLTFIILALVSGIIDGIKKGTEKWKNGKKDLKKNTTN